jgi:hypothetical protein
MDPRKNSRSKKVDTDTAQNLLPLSAPTVNNLSNIPTLAQIPVGLESRAQRFAVLAVIEDYQAEDDTIHTRAEWWLKRSKKLREMWCERNRVAVPWHDTLCEWLLLNPYPPVDEQFDAANPPPLFVHPSWSAPTQRWCRSRDEALLEAEWYANGGEGSHDFDYAAVIGDDFDTPPLSPSLQEPAVIAIGACETLEDAEALAKTAGMTKELQHVDIFVCAMYEWGRLESRHEAAKKNPRQLDEVLPSLLR